jgi:hypothetical protein
VRSNGFAQPRGKSAQRLGLTCGRRIARYKLQITRPYLRTLVRTPFAMRPDLSGLHDRVCRMLFSRIFNAVRLRSRFACGHFK